MVLGGAREQPSVSLSPSVLSGRRRCGRVLRLRSAGEVCFRCYPYTPANTSSTGFKPKSRCCTRSRSLFKCFTVPDKLPNSRLSTHRTRGVLSFRNSLSYIFIFGGG